MKVGIIAPIKMLRSYCTTSVQYYLPGLLENEEYREFYSTLPKGTTKIMDCRKPIWRGKPEDLEICKLGCDLQPNYIILPSLMFNPEETVKVGRKYASKLNCLNSKLIACLEGTTKKEVLDCAKSLGGFSGYAIPSHLYSICKKIPRSKLTIYIENYSKYNELEGLNGILVTSLPVRLGLQGRLLSDYLPSPSSLTFYEREDKYPLVVEKNIKEDINFYGE